MGQFTRDLDGYIDSQLAVVSAAEVPLHGNTGKDGNNEPEVELQKEQPQHRAMVMLKAQGKTNRWIAEHLKYSPVHVGNVLRQPWARELLVRVIAEAGSEPLKKIFEVEAYESVETLKSLRDNPNVPAGVRASAAFHFLDRHLGKPVARTESESVVAHLSLSEIEERIARAREQVAERMGVAKASLVTPK